MNTAGLLPKMLGRARTSRLWLAILNATLGRMIPFNRPHRFRVLEVGVDFIRTAGPYRRGNFNHIRGIHACGIATVAEFSSGLLLLSRLDPGTYRLIMSRLNIEYLYQAKSAIVAETALDDARLKAEILEPLAKDDSLMKTLQTTVVDEQGNLVARADITWQIKPWSKVRTRVA
jgi:acyl-coenzyme A thioesterase PaaI-like protein